jgi:hypothetical protein
LQCASEKKTKLQHMPAKRGVKAMAGTRRSRSASASAADSGDARGGAAAARPLVHQPSPPASEALPVRTLDAAAEPRAVVDAAPVRAEAAAQRSLQLPAEFPRVSRDVALQQLGALARLTHYQVPTETLVVLDRHVRTLRDVFGRPVDKSEVPNLALATTPGAGKTALLRYLQQTADTVRYGAELHSDTNWLAKGWGAPRSAAVKNAAQSVPALRHVFVGYATFKQGSDTSFDPTIDTEATIQRRCAWRILHDAGLVPEWSPSFDLDLAQAAKALRAKISAAKGCTPGEVAIVFLLDDVTDVAEGPRRVLLDAIAAWQQQELADARPSLFGVTGFMLFELGEPWVKCSRPIAALPLPPL